MRTDRERLLDIAEAITQIEKYAARGKAAFERDELIQTWIVHHLQIIGEAAARLSDDARARCKEIAWSGVIGMRNILVHNYFGIDTGAVWAAVEKDIPILKQSIEAAIREFPKRT